MDFIRELASSATNKKPRKPASHSTRTSMSRRKGGNGNGRSANTRQQIHFHDPDNQGLNASSSEDLSPSDLDRRQVKAMASVEDAEAVLAKERKRVEHLGFQKQELKNRDEERLARQDETAQLSPRERNHVQYQRAISRVERRALREIEHLERRFAYSDKLFEMRMQGKDEEVEQAAEEANKESCEA